MSLPAPHCCLSGSFSHSLALKCSLLLPTRGAGLSSLTALASAPLPSLLQTHCSALIWVMSLPDTGSFVTTCKWACLSKLLGSSERKQPQLIGNQPKSLGSPFPGGEIGGLCVFSFLPLFLSISINLDQVSTIYFREIFSKSKYFLHGILLYQDLQVHRK